MKNLFFLIFIIFSFLFFSGCTHINELPNYNLKGSKILIKHTVNVNMKGAEVSIDYNIFSKNLLEVVVEGLGAGYVETEVNKKLYNSVNIDSVSMYISNGLKEGLETYLGMIVVINVEEEPDLIFESILDNIKLKSDSYGVYAFISTRGRLIDRKTAKLIWQNDETYSVPFGIILYYYSGDKKIRKATGIINAIRLLQMTEEEIRESVIYIAEEVGKKQCEQFRVDLTNE